MIILLGMHRSGTSALAGMLHSGGVHLGEAFMSPLPENPKGFFEDSRLQSVNKQILASIEKDWYDVPTLQDLERVPESVLQLMPQVYAYFRSRFKFWAWKDPRLCMTFPLWANILPLKEVQVLFVVRHPMSVARSLHTRNQMPIEQGLELWRVYNLRITELLEHYRLPYTFVRYESLVENPRVIQSILEDRLGIALKDAWRFIDVKLNRSEIKNSTLPKNIQETYDYLLKEWDNFRSDLSSEIKQVVKQGEDHFAAGDLEAAKRCFRQVLETDPDHIEALNNLGVIAFHKGAVAKATSYFRRVLEIDEDYLEAIENLARCLKAKGDFLEAVKLYRRALELGRVNTDILNSMGNCFTQLQQLNAAYEAYKKSFQIDGNQAHIKSLLQELETFIRSQEKKGVRGGMPLLATPEKLKRLLAKDRYRIQIISFSDFETNEKRRLRWGDYWVKWELQKEFEKLGHIVVDKDPDIFLHLFGVPVKGLPEAAYKIIWIHSHPDMVSHEILRQYDQIYCLSPSFLKKISDWGLKGELLVGGTAKKPLKRELGYDIVFVGNAKGPSGRQIIRDLGKTSYKFKVWGEGWENILPPENYGGLYYKNEGLAELYASSKIVLNDHHEDMRREGFLNPRILDVFASGGFVISDDIKGLEDLFGEALVTYRNAEELKGLINFYIEHPEDRESIIKTGQAIALQFTFSRMVQHILSHFDSDFFIFNEQGDSYYSQGMLKEAERCFGKALALKARNLDAAYGLARVYLKQGRKEESIAALKKCMAVDPTFEKADNLLKQELLDSISLEGPQSHSSDLYTFIHVSSHDNESFLEMTPTVIVAFDAICKHNPDFSLLVCSRRKLRDYPWEIIDIVKDNTRIDFQDTVGETVDIGRGSIFLCPAKTDAAQANLAQVLPLGIPVIAAATPFVRRIVKHGYNGFMVQVAEVQKDGQHQYLVNINDLATKMFFLASDLELRAEMATNALQTSMSSQENLSQWSRKEFG
jgi:tetratricopeptide (TPR) repeat protein